MNLIRGLFSIGAIVLLFLGQPLSASAVDNMMINTDKETVDRQLI